MQHKRDVYSAQFSPDGKLVATASAEETAQLWEAETGKAVGNPMQQTGVRSAQFTPDGKQVVTTTSKGNTVQFWDAKTGKAMGEPKAAGKAHFPGGIHIEFADVGEYPRLLLALFIVHEATHKFADTEDRAYTETKKKIKT